MSQIMGMDMATISQVKTMKGKSKCIPWEFLKKFLAKCEDEEWIFTVFSIVLYGMVIFPKVSNHIEAVVVDDKGEFCIYFILSYLVFCYVLSPFCMS